MPITSEVIAIPSEVITINSENFRRKGHNFRILSFDKKIYYVYLKINNSNELLLSSTKRARTYTRERFSFFEASHLANMGERKKARRKKRKSHVDRDVTLIPNS